MDKIHAPALMRPARRRRNPAMEARVLATTDPVTQLQAFQPIKPPYALHVHCPTIATEQDMNAAVTVSWARLGELAHPHPQSLLAWPAAPIRVQRTRDPDQPTRSREAGAEGAPHPLDELALPWRP